MANKKEINLAPVKPSKHRKVSKVMLKSLELLKHDSITPLERLKLQKDVLSAMFQEFRNHARHLETLRSTVNNMLIVAAIAIFGLATFDKTLDSGDYPACGLLILISVLGFGFSLAYTERVLKFKRLAAETRLELDKIIFQIRFGRSLKQVVRKGKAGNKLNVRRYPILGRFSQVISSHFFWLMLPGFIFFAGIALFTYSCSGTKETIKQTTKLIQSRVR